MTKNLASLILVVSACVIQTRAEIPVSFRCDFNNGIPETIKLVDNDRNEPSADVAVYGFATGKPWIDVRADESHVRCAASTSWYKSAATSDDWMILPKVKIESPDYILSWEARAHDDVLSDGYAVYVSDAGDDVTDFKQLEAAFICNAENPAWTARKISLAGYAGKEVSIAFVNNSCDKALLYLDNISIEEKKPLSISGFVPSLLPVGTVLTLDGAIVNNTDVDIRRISVNFRINGKSYEKSDPSITIPAHQSVHVSLPTDFVSDAMVSHPYTLTVSCDEYSISEDGVLLSVRQNVLMEEGTGTWCKWCPRGIVAIERLKDKYPATFIPVAVHTGDHMTVEGYSVYTSSGYPVCVANRIDQLRGDPRDMETYYLDAAGRQPVAAIVSTGAYDSASKKISVDTQLAFAREYTDAPFALQYIVLEDNVHSENPRYNQQNGYAGGDEEMGGFENLPDPVPAALMWYQEVGRMLVGGDNGIEGSIPAYIAAGELLFHSHDIILADNIMNPDEIKVIAAIVDSRKGEVVNSAYVTVAGLSALPEVEACDDVRIMRDGNMLRIVSDYGVESLSLISMAGTTVCESRCGDSIDISGYPCGLYIVRVKVNGKVLYFKQII